MSIETASGESKSPEQVESLLHGLEALEPVAQNRRQEYMRTIDTMGHLCVGLSGVGLKITGTLQSRNNTSVFSGNPESAAEDLPVHVDHARVTPYEMGVDTEKPLPLTVLFGTIIKSGERFSARLRFDADDSVGVTAKVIELPTVET